MAGLYLHIPFCSQRCVYCDFYFVTTRRSHTSFIEAAVREIEHYAAEYGKREPLDTIYFGGGTPSRLALEEVARLLEAVHMGFETSGLKETTFELNPDDGELDYLRGLSGLGVDRLSIGVQSFFPADLEFMNRSHTAEQADEVLENARRAGFDDISVDLIFGLPDQPEEYWAANVQKLIRRGVPHISTYSLTVEERTPLYRHVQRGLVQPPPEESLEERYRFTMNFLRENGYEHYEISSFALPGKRSTHNQLYWNHANYLGIGPSAHSFWWKGLPAYRWHNERNLNHYEALLTQRRLPLGGKEALSLDHLANEYILLRLRVDDGIDLNLLESRYGVDLLEEKSDSLAMLEADGYIDRTGADRLRLTDSGKLLCDSITSRLLLDLV